MMKLGVYPEDWSGDVPDHGDAFGERRRQRAAKRWVSLRSTHPTRYIVGRSGGSGCRVAETKQVAMERSGDMSPGQSRSQGASKNAAAIVKLCQQELEPLGFIHPKGATLWRRTNLKLDILKFDIIPRARCEKWRVPLGSFALAPSCLFPFLPRLGHRPNERGLQPEKGVGQVRLSIRREIPQPKVKAPNIWWAGDSAEIFEPVLKDVLGTINEKALPFFSRFEDAEELLRTFLEDEDMIGREGIWEFGKEGSIRRSLYTGFAAIECCKWDLAISSLQTCRQKIMAVPQSIRKRIQAEILPYVDQGITCAEQKCTWSLG
jgi:hypothetical protein